MRRFGLLAALATLRPGLASPLLAERLAQRRAGLDDGTQGGMAAAKTAFTLPPGAILDSDVAYGSDPEQCLDVYRPADARAAPVILFVHGGGWRRGDKAMLQMVRNKVAHWVGKGYVFVSTNYRMRQAANPVEQAEDVSRALAFVQGRAGSWGGDPARVILMGHSAGAHLVALITADPGLATRHGAQPWLATIAMDSAAFDMEAIMQRKHYRFYDPVFGSDPGFWREASPMHRLKTEPAAPMLAVCSAQRDDSCPQARAFAAKAESLGGRVAVLPVDLSHLEINDLLGSPGEYTERVNAFLRSLGLP